MGPERANWPLICGEYLGQASSSQSKGRPLQNPEIRRKGDWAEIDSKRLREGNRKKMTKTTREGTGD